MRAVWTVLMWAVITLGVIAGVVIMLLFQTSTRYAPKYRESVFRGVTNGTPERLVRSLLGEPLKEVWGSEGRLTFIYAWHKESRLQPLSSHYRSRMITFSNEVVVAKHAALDWD